MVTPNPTMVGRMVVAHYLDGGLLKGTTQDFLPNKPQFHVYEDGDENSPAIEVTVEKLKAVFFVKDFDGRKNHVDDYNFDKSQGHGRKCLVLFEDGEVIAGYTNGYSKERPGFFIVPAEDDSNNGRVFVVNQAVKTLTWV